jgi:ubiquinone/menaquinone biosynthesis C-methylase UbiE
MQDGNNETAYVMGSSDADLERLVKQAHLFQGQTRSLLQSIGLSEGMRALDLGCGPVGILDLLSEQVGAAGQVVGIDSNPRMIAEAERFIAARGLTNVRVAVADALETGLPRASFELVHERLLLTNVWDAEAVVTEMVALTRPGGVVAFQDVDEAAWFCEPPHRAWTQLQEAFLRVFTAAGRQPYIGRQLFGLLKRAGLANVELAAFPELWRSDDFYRSRLLTFVDILREPIVDSRVLAEGELDALKAQLQAHLDDPGTIVFGGLHFQAWGRKP